MPSLKVGIQKFSKLLDHNENYWFIIYLFIYYLK